MRIIISERQYGTLKEQTSTNLNLKGVKAVNVPVKKELSPEQIKADQQMGHEMNAVLQMVTVFIPYIGPYISTTIGAADAQLYWNEGDKTSAALASVFALLPGIGGALSTKIPGIKALGQEGMNKLASKIIKGEKTLTPLETQVTKQIGKESKLIKDEVKKVLSLEKNSIKTPKVARDYGIIKISDNLELITKPRWKEYVAQVKSLKNPEDFMDLKKGVDELGDYYYMSTKMSNPIDAGRAFQKLIEYIPKGARFVERATGSLSTDSFYSMLRRSEKFQPKVVGKIRMNSSGVKRFQDLITNTVKSNAHPPILTFRKSSDAAPLIKALNDELEKAGIEASASVSRNAKGFYEVLIPNIQFIVK
jgi:hypothetical protein